MKITFKIGKFLEALDIVNLTLDKSGNLDTKDVLLLAGIDAASNERLFFYSTDFVNQSMTFLDVTVEEPGSFPFNINQLYIALSKRNPEDNATIICDSKQSVIKIGKSKFKLNTSASQTLVPRLKAIPFNDPVLLEISPVDLIDVFKRSKVCVSTDTNNTNRQLLRGIHIKSINNGYVVEATDGFSASSIVLSQELSDKDQGIDIIIPGEFTSILLALCNRAKKDGTNIKFIKTNHLFFKHKNTIIGTSVLMGKFHDVTKMVQLSRPAIIAEIDHTTFKTCLDRILGFESTDMIILEVKDQQIAIKSQSDCEEFIPLPEHIGAPLYQVKINGRRLLEIIGTNSLGTIQLGIPTTSDKPLYIEEVIPKRLASMYVIMPTRF